MTGAGSAEFAYVTETSYLGGVSGTPTYVYPGRDPRVEEANLQNQLQRLADPDEPTPVESIPGNFEGALSVSWAIMDNTYQELVFPSTDGSGNYEFPTGGAVMPSAEFYLGVDYLNGTAERQLQGCVFTEASVTYQQGEPNRFNGTLVYGDEAFNTSLTPGTVDRSGSTSDFAEASLSINSVSQTKLQEATLTLSPLGRLHRGTSRHPVDAVLDYVRPTLTVDSIITETDQLKAALGGSSATAVQDEIDAVSGSLTFSAGGSTVLDYSLSEMRPNTYNWNDLINPEEDITESIEFAVDGVTAVESP